MLRIAHISDVVDGRANSGTARVASELIKTMSKIVDVHQTLIHYQKSNEDIYRIKGIQEIVIPLKNFPFIKHFLSFISYWIKILIFSRNFKKYDLVIWHSSRVYPFFFMIPSRYVFINLHDANARIIKENTIWTHFFYWNLRLSVYFVDVIFGVSQDACNKLITIGKFPKSKIKCLYPGSNFNNLKSIAPTNLKAKSKFFLCVSRWQTFKNVENLIRGYRLALSNNTYLPKLVLVGKDYHEGKSPVRDLIYSLELTDNVIILQDLKDEELAFLFDHAIVNVNPSLHEGFGLSVLEGIKRGCPSLDHKFTSTSEISGAAGMHIDMTSISEISNALIQINNDPKILKVLRNQTQDIANKFTWENTVRNLITIFEERSKSNQC